MYAKQICACLEKTETNYKRHFSHFCALFLNFVKKRCENAETHQKDVLDQQWGCEAPARRWKYSTHTQEKK